MPAKVEIADVIAAENNFRMRLSIIAHRQTTNGDAGLAPKRLDFSDEHLRTKIPVVLVIARSEIDDAESLVGAFEFGAEDVGIGHVILLGFERGDGKDGKFTALVRIHSDPNRKLLSNLGMHIHRTAA